MNIIIITITITITFKITITIMMTITITFTITITIISLCVCFETRGSMVLIDIERRLLGKTELRKMAFTAIRRKTC